MSKVGKYRELMTDDELEGIVKRFMNQCDEQCSCSCIYAEHTFEDEWCAPEIIFEVYRHWVNLKESMNNKDN